MMANTASKPGEKPKDIDEGGIFENVPSELDDNTHTEMCMLYNESAKSIRFAKHHQWSIVGATLLIFAGFMVVSELTTPNPDLGAQLTGISILVSCASIFILIMYQFWQYNEVHKMNYMAEQLSSLFSEVRSLKSSLEGNVHRYIMLIFMIVMILIGAIVTNIGINKIMMYP